MVVTQVRTPKFIHYFAPSYKYRTTLKVLNNVTETDGVCRSNAAIDHKPIKGQWDTRSFIALAKNDTDELDLAR